MTFDRRAFLRNVAGTSVSLWALQPSVGGAVASGADSVAYFAEGYEVGFFPTTRDDTIAQFQKLFSRIDTDSRERFCIAIEGYMLERMLDGASFDSEAPGRVYEAPELLERLRREVEAGRIEIVGGTYTHPIWPSHDGEGWVRQFDFGTRAARRALGVEVKSYATQEDGFISQLPQILTGFGIDGALFRAHWQPWGSITRFNLESFQWQGPDGTRVRAIPHYEFDMPTGFQMFATDVTRAWQVGIRRPLVSLVDDFLGERPPTTTGSRNGMEVWAAMAQSIPAEAVRGKTVTFSGWIRSAVEQARLQLDIGTYPNSIANAPTDGEWHRVELQYAVPAYAQVLNPQAKFYGRKGEAWISGLSMKVVGDSRELLLNSDFTAGGASPLDWAVWRSANTVVQNTTVGFATPAPGVTGRGVRVQFEGIAPVPVTLREYLALIDPPVNVAADAMKDVPRRWAWGILGGELEQRCRSAQRLTEAAERAACLYAADDSGEVANAWRLVLMANHHDTLSCFPSPFGQWRKSEPYADHCREWTADAESRATRVLRKALGILNADSGSVTAFNPVACARSLVMIQSRQPQSLQPSSWFESGTADPLASEAFSLGVDASGSSRGELQAWRADLSSLSHRGYELRNDANAAAPRVMAPCSSADLENEFYRVSLNSDRGLIGIFDKRLNKDLLAAPVFYAGFFPAGGVGAQSVVTELRACQGTLLGVAEVDGMLANVPIRQRMLLRQGSALVELEIEADFGARSFIGAATSNLFPGTLFTSDYVDDAQKLRLVVSSSLPFENAWSDQSYDVVRAAAGTNWAVSWFAGQGKDGGLAVLMDRSSGFRWNAGALECILAYGGRFAFGPATGIPLTGRKQWRMAFTGFEGTWETARVPELAEMFDRAPLLLPGRALSDSPARVSIEGQVVAGAVYGVGSWPIVRLYNPYTGPQVVSVKSPDLKRAWEVTLQAAPLRELPCADGVCQLTIDPKRLVTLGLQL